MRVFPMLLLALSLPAAAEPLPKAIFTDPPADAVHPAHTEVLHIPSGGVEFNGILLVPGGAGPHPVVLLFHGLPGNEKNLDLAQAIRRAGWAVAAINYRGSWGSPGVYRFANDLEDAQAAIAYLRDPAHAKELGIDSSRIALVGHSLGGWVAAQTLGRESGLLGAAIISAADIGKWGLMARQNRPSMLAFLTDNGLETLADSGAEKMADESAAHGEEWSFATLAPKLVGKKLDVLYSKDVFQQQDEALIAGIKAAGGKPETHFVATDHVWSDHRIALQALVLNWLQGFSKGK
jgi:acetyl esterase/lipase